ncbi:MAG: hypothetical protein WDM89_01465 [Rhizomicrobium sp.]
MRAMFTVAVSLVAFALVGCDQDAQETHTAAAVKPAAATATAAAAPCKCSHAVAAAPAHRLFSNYEYHHNRDYHDRYEHADNRAYQGRYSHISRHSTGQTAASAGEYRSDDDQQYDDHEYAEAGAPESHIDSTQNAYRSRGAQRYRYDEQQYAEPNYRERYAGSAQHRKQPYDTRRQYRPGIEQQYDERSYAGSDYSETRGANAQSGMYSDEEQYGANAGAAPYDTSGDSAQSQVYSGGAQYGAGAGGGQYQQGATAQATWVDGYGRMHYADYGPLSDEHPGLISRKDERERQKVWRGYDSDCDNWAD